MCYVSETGRTKCTLETILALNGRVLPWILREKSDSFSLEQLTLEAGRRTEGAGVCWGFTAHVQAQLRQQQGCWGWGILPWSVKAGRSCPCAEEIPLYREEYFARPKGREDSCSTATKAVLLQEWVETHMDRILQTKQDQEKRILSVVFTFFASINKCALQTWKIKFV